MENIILNWLKRRFLNCFVNSSSELKNYLNRNSIVSQWDVVSTENGYKVSLYDESTFVKDFLFTIVNNKITEITC